MTVGTATGATTGTATTSSVATGALTPSGAALMSHLYGGNGNSGYGGYSSRRAYGSGYGSRYYGNGNNSQYFAQMRRLSQLVNALNNLTVGSTVSQLQTSRVHSGLVGVVFGNARPPSQPVYQLAKHLASTLPNRKIPMMNTGQLARDLAVVMNGRGHNTSQIHQAIGSAESIMNQSGVAGPGIQAIASDLRMVASAGNLMNGMARIP